MENKTLHPTARSPLVGGVVWNFMAPPPFQHSPPLLAVDELVSSPENLTRYAADP